jgi:hypothetical protein
VSIYGPLVPPSMVEREILRILKLWAPAYLAELGGQIRNDRAALQDVQAWERVGQFPLQLPERLLPYVAIVSPGTADAPVRDSDTYTTTLQILVGVIAGAGGDDAEQDARDLAGDYGHALTAALVHKATTSPLIDDIVWRVQNLGERPPSGDLALQAAVNTFWVYVGSDSDTGGVLDVHGGPPEPPDDPRSVMPDLGAVEEIDITIDTESNS